jgi:hypothetical protein
MSVSEAVGFALVAALGVYLVYAIFRMTRG